MEAGVENRGALQAISEGTVKLFRAYTGHVPTNAYTTITEDLVTVLMADILTQDERRLATNGSAQGVLDARQEFRQMMRDELVALVEAELGREVLAFIGVDHLDLDIAVEAFVLATDE